jgi:hypothetical protein
VTLLVSLLALVVVLLVVLVVGLLRSHAEILRALHDLGVNLEDGAPASGPREFKLRTNSAGSRSPGVTPAGTPAAERISDQGGALPVDGPLGRAHDLMGVTPAGDAAAITVASGHGMTLLAFLTSGCAACLDFWDAFAEPANRTIGGPQSRLVVLTKGPGEESPAALIELAHPDLVTLMSTEAFEDYSVPIAPYFVLVDSPTGAIVGEGAASTFDQLASLLSKALADSGHGSPPRTRREVLRGLRRATADEALEAAGIGPGHPSLHEDPQPDRGGSPQ